MKRPLHGDDGPPGPRGRYAPRGRDACLSPPRRRRRAPDRAAERTPGRLRIRDAHAELIRRWPRVAVPPATRPVGPERIMSAMPAPSERPGPPPAPPEPAPLDARPAPASRRRRRLIVAAGVAAVMVLATVAVWRLF